MFANQATVNKTMQSRIDTISSNWQNDQQPFKTDTNNTLAGYKTSIDCLKQTATDFNDLKSKYATYTTTTNNTLSGYKTSIDSLKQTATDFNDLKSKFTTYTTTTNPILDSLKSSVSSLDNTLKTGVTTPFAKTNLVTSYGQQQMKIQSDMGKSILGANITNVVVWRADGSIVTGPLSTASGIQITNQDPGALVERKYTDNDRYGVGQFANKTTRVYAGSGKLASVNLSLVKSDGTFNDVLKVDPINRVTVAGDMNLTGKLYQGGKEIALQSGVQGPPGHAGPQRPQGPTGAKGATGDKGPTGDKGATGDKGPTGERGLQGPQGERGPTGLQGLKGETGATGLAGPQGKPGDQGPRGDQVPKGEQGPTGLQGPQGEKGPTGERGLQGLQGPTGLQGPRGDKGPTGDAFTGPASLDNVKFRNDGSGLIWGNNYSRIYDNGDLHIDTYDNLYRTRR